MDGSVSPNECSAEGTRWPKTHTFRFNRRSWFFASSNQRPGFDAADVRAICDVNASTKAGDAATTGHKGIGFKAVFAMCDRPCVLSNGFAFYFDAARDGPLGLVAPRWLELNDEVVRGVEEAAVLAAGAGGGGAARSAYMLVYGRGDALPEVAFSLQPVPLS